MIKSTISNRNKTNEPSGEALTAPEIGHDILRQLKNVVDFKTASLQLIQDGERSLLARIGFIDTTVDPYLLRPIEEDKLINRVIVTRQPLILSETAGDNDWIPRESTLKVQSWICAPVIYRDSIIGLLTIDHDTPSFYNVSHGDKVRSFCDQISSQVWSARLWVGTDRLARDRKIFADVLRVINETLGIESLLNTIAKQIAEKLKCTHCTIFLAQPTKEDPEELILVPKVSQGGRPETMQRCFKPKEGIAGWVFDNGISEVLFDATRDSRFAMAREKRDAPRSMLVAPIKVGNEITGIVSADQDEAGWFSKSDLWLVDALAQQAGIAIQRARALTLLFDITKKIIGNDDVRKILRDVVLRAIELTNTSTGVIYLISDNGLEFTEKFAPHGFPHPDPRMNNENGLTRTAIRSGKLRVIDDTKEVLNINPNLINDFQSMIVVPMKAGNRVIGVFYLHDKDRHIFTEMEKTILLTLANQAAIAIQNARLLSGLQQSLKAHTVFEKVLGNLALQEPNQVNTYKSIVRGIQGILGEEVSISINMFNEETGQFGECHPYGPLKDFLNVPPRRQAGTGTFVVEKKRPLYLEDVNNPPPDCPTVRQEAISQGIKSFAAIPLERRSRIVGVLFVNSQKYLKFDAQIIHLLNLFALQAGVAIEIADYHSNAQYQVSLVKAADLGFLAGGITHEFRNRLQSIDVHIREIEVSLQSTIGEEISAYIKKLRGETEKAENIISTFQSFAHQMDDLDLVDLNKIISQAVELSAQRTKDHGISLIYQSTDVGLIKANKSWVSSIIINILRNAIDAIDTMEQIKNHEKKVEIILSKDSNSVKIELKDSGPGLSSELLKNLFIPFYTMWYPPDNGTSLKRK